VDGLKFGLGAKIADDNYLWMGTSCEVNHIGFTFYENISFSSPEKNNGHYLRGGKPYG